ncbi:MAG: endoglucanase, partial [Candidatus Dormibacteraeota bacterium]|nr:endoglucanase [Candidatus Dormibacteraeota bacterium]
RPSGWQTPAQIFASLLATVQSVAPATPVVINETGSVEAGGSKSSWISELFQYVRGSQMIGVVYSNFGSNWPLTSSSAALAAAAAALAAY